MSLAILEMMKAIDILKEAEGTKFEDEDGEVEELKLLPPLNNAELNQLESQLPCPVPEDVRQLFTYCRGFEGVFESIDFRNCLSIALRRLWLPLPLHPESQGFVDGKKREEKHAKL
jgi:hypothetical protein